MTKKALSNPYPYPLEDLMCAEKDYCIQVGDDFYTVNGAIVFPHDIAKEMYENIIFELQDMLRNGTEEEKNDARFFIFNVHILPIRIH